MNLKLWLLLCSSLTVLAGATLSPSLPAMTQVFSHMPNTALWVKFLVAAPGVAVALSAFYFGKLLDIYSKIRILYYCLAAYGVFGSAGYFFDDNLWAIIATRLALGFAVAGIMVAVTTVAMEYLSGEGFNKYIGMQAAFGSFGAVLFLFVSGLLSYIDWRFPFLLHAMGLVLLIISVFVRYPRNASNQTGRQISEESEPGPVQAMPEKPILFLFAFLGFAEMLLLYVIPLNLPFYLDRRFDMNEGVIGVVLSGFFLLMAIVSFNYSAYAKKMTCLNIHLYASLFLCVGFNLLLLVEFILVHILSFCLLALGFGMLRPNLVVWLFSCCGYSVRGKVMGIVTTAFFMGQFASPLFIQLAERIDGEKGMWGAGIFLALLLSVLAYWLHLRLTRSPGDTPKYFLKAKEKLEV